MGTSGCLGGPPTAMSSHMACMNGLNLERMKLKVILDSRPEFKSHRRTAGETENSWVANAVLA